jgi:small-conductance mechanosensitive channel
MGRARDKGKGQVAINHEQSTMNQMKFKILIYFAISIIFFMQIKPGLTQTSPNLKPDFLNLEQLESGLNNDREPKSPIIIDGKKIFSVGGIGGSDAVERAEIVQEKILEAIEASPNTNVTIKDGNTIYANGIRILNITSADIVEGELLQTRAWEWKTKIEKAIQRAQLERSPIYIQRRGIIALLLLLFAIIGSRFLDRLQKYPFRQAIQKIIPGIPSNTSHQPSNITTFFRVKLGFAQFALWIVTLLIILEFFPLFRQWRYIGFRALNESFLIFGGSEFSVFKVLILIGLFLCLILVSTYLTDLLRSKILQITRMNRGSQDVILIVTKYGLISIGTIVLLQTSGLNLSSLALLGSALGVGIGFGFQDIAKNFASGLVLLFERTIKVGDFIQVGEHLGIVEKVGARSIVLKTLDRVSIVVPNSRFLAEEVINWNHNNTASRLHLPVGIAYGSDVGKVKSALLKAAEENRDVLRYPQPQVFFTEFGDNSLNLELLVWVSDPSRQEPIKSDLYFRIEEIVRELNIEIPFPQQDIHLRTGELPLTVSPQLENYLMMLLRNLNSRNSSKHN